MAADQYDLLNYYYPDKADVSVERVAGMRAVISALLLEAIPGTDTGVGTVLGDLYISPSAWDLAAKEIAWSRFLSDLNPENARQGIVYNCEFVRRYFQNFGIHDSTGQGSWGMLRLIFETDDEREIDVSTVFLLDNQSYQMSLPLAGPLYLGGEPVANTNHLPYIRIGPDSWSVDVLVRGPAGSEIDILQTARVDRTIDGLVSATTVTKFLGGSTPGELQELARRILTNFHSRQPVTRGGAQNMIRQQFPEITAVSAVISGDPEMLRHLTNPGQIAGGRIDLHVRGPELVSDTVILRIPRTAAETGFHYAQLLALPQTPIRIESITWRGTPVAHELISISKRAETPGLSAAYGRDEQLLLVIPAGAHISPTLIESVFTADFELTYKFDPMLAAAQEFASHEENQAAGLDLYVRGFVPVEIQQLDVRYYRKSGVEFDREQARAEILNAFNLHTLEKPAGAWTITDSMHYAGAHSVSSISINATTIFSPASLVWMPGHDFVMPSTSGEWATFNAACEEVPSATAITNIYEPGWTFTDPTTFAAAGDRNVSWLLKPENLKLIEERAV